MTQKEIYKWFKNYFPSPEDYLYFPHGKNSIRIRKNNGQEFIFTFIKPYVWRLESMSMHKNERRNV